MSRLSCDAVEETGLVGRYVAESLEPPEEAVFEEHLITCASCQEAVRLAAVVRSELAPRDGTSSVARWSGGRFLWGGLAVAAAAAAAVLLIGRGGATDPALVALGGVGEPPVYLGVPVRSAPDPADATFEEGMRAYDAGRYAEAAGLLERSREAGWAEAPAAFFGGVSLLLDDRPAEAAETLARVPALGDTPYREEAAYYRAKALLRLGRAEESLEALGALAGADHPFAPVAEALADSVREVARR